MKIENLDERHSFSTKIGKNQQPRKNCRQELIVQPLSSKKKKTLLKKQG